MDGFLLVYERHQADIYMISELAILMLVLNILSS